MLHNGFLLLAALNLAVNAALGLVVLLHCRRPLWPVPAKRPDRGREEPEPKTATKGATP